METIKITIDKTGTLTQWDIDRYVIIEGIDSADFEVHFAVATDDRGAYVVKPEAADGLIRAKIPNLMLTEPGLIYIYAYPPSYTRVAAQAYVSRREKPDNYVYTETEVMTYRTLDKKIGDLTDLETKDKSSIVAAINEAMHKVAGEVDIYMRVNDGMIQYSSDGKKWEDLIAIAELKGEKGNPGKDGSPGKDGESVSIRSISESAESGGENIVTFDDGSTLTVKNGKKGERGADGAKGDKGDTGAQGEPGKKGDKGDPGAQGAKGDKGADGTTPTIGTNGNWYIGDTDTGKPSRGEKGEKGERGDKGDTGAKGDKGDPGSDASIDIVSPSATSTSGQAADAKAVWDMLGDVKMLIDRM